MQLAKRRKLVELLLNGPLTEVLDRATPADLGARPRRPAARRSRAPSI
jgi:hypothetical protein